MKQFFVWTVAALIFAAGYALYLIYSDVKDVYAKQQFVSPTLCATLGGK